MEQLFAISTDFQNYQHYFALPFMADINTKAIQEGAHFVNSFDINYNQISKTKTIAVATDTIDKLHFMYVNFGERQFDAKYWFCVGQLTNGIYFSYESGCSGTGFHLGETSTIFSAKTQELLHNFGLSDKQRTLIRNNIDKDQRFLCAKN